MLEAENRSRAERLGGSVAPSPFSLSTEIATALPSATSTSEPDEQVRAVSQQQEPTFPALELTTRP